MDAVHEEKVDDLTLRIYQDEAPEDPREWCDHLGHMIAYHGRYDLGDNNQRRELYPHQEDLHDFMNENDAVNGVTIIHLPLYLMDHSGLMMKTTPFDCPWDSGMVGWIFVTKEEIQKEYNVEKVDAALCKKVQRILRAEVEEYHQYLTGDVYGYTITREETCKHCKHTEEIHLDSCWGFYGFDYAKEQAKAVFKHQHLPTTI